MGQVPSQSLHRCLKSIFSFCFPLLSTPSLPQMPAHSSQGTGSLGFLSCSTLLLPTLPDERQRMTWPLCHHYRVTLVCPFWSLSKTRSALNILTTHLAFTLTPTCIFKLDSWNSSSFLQGLKGLLKDRDHISSISKVPLVARFRFLWKSSHTLGPGSWLWFPLLGSSITLRTFSSHSIMIVSLHVWFHSQEWEVFVHSHLNPFVHLFMQLFMLLSTANLCQVEGAISMKRAWSDPQCS